jgi:hypothetical protein
MDPTDRSTDTRVTRTIQSEAELIRDAIEFVATGGSERVTVAGLRFGSDLLDQSRELAGSRGVRVEPAWSTDEVGGVDIVVERISDRSDR